MRGLMMDVPLSVSSILLHAAQYHGKTQVAEKALESSVDRLILVNSGAGGHAGTLSPFALLGEVRRFYDGPVILSGANTTGNAILAAEVIGADLAYMGTRFIATAQANIAPRSKEMVTTSSAADILYKSYFTGVAGSYIKLSIVASWLDPDAWPLVDKSQMNFGSSRVKAWRDIWGAGQRVRTVADVPPTADLVARLPAKYREAYTDLLARALPHPSDELLSRPPTHSREEPRR